MYNVDQKEAFISETYCGEAEKKLIKNVFLQLERFELEYGMDFSLFGTDELKRCIPSVIGVRSSSGGVVLSYLKTYVKWCSARGAEIDPAIFSYEPDLSRKAAESYVRDPEHLLYVLDYVFADTQFNEIEYVYRSYLWLAYFGFKESEAALVCERDVNLRSLTIKNSTTGKMHGMYVEAVHDILMTCTKQRFTEHKRGSETPEVINVNRAPGDEILRGKHNMQADSVGAYVATTVRQLVSKRFADARRRYAKEGKRDDYLESLSLSYKRVYLSGMFYRAQQREALGLDCGFDEIAKDHIRSRKIDGKVRNESDAAYMVKWKYKEDYEVWKRAFRASTLEE